MKTDWDVCLQSSECAAGAPPPRQRRAGGWEEAIFGRISHHPFGPQCSREFATLHISCRKQQFPSLSLESTGCRPAGWLALWVFLMLFAPKDKKCQIPSNCIYLWLLTGSLLHNSWVLLLGAGGWMGGWVNDRLTSSMGLFQTAFDWRCVTACRGAARVGTCRSSRATKTRQSSRQGMNSLFPLKGF